MERDCESELSKLNIEQNACIYHFGASVIHGQRSNILRLLTKDIVFNALERLKIKKPNSLYEQIFFDTMQDAKSIEVLHIGAYDDEPISFQKMNLLAEENGLVRSTNYHREIYLNNANRVLKSKLKTILRYCVE